MLNFKEKNLKSQKILSFRTAFLLLLCAAGMYTFNALALKSFAKDDLSIIFWYISPGAPYVQNWSDTVSISQDDNWDNFIAIMGYRGDNLTAAEGVNPQSVLAAGENTPVDVIANQSNPNTLVQGGVAEFDGIGNPTVALKGDATADAPQLVIRINNKNCPDSKAMTVSYTVRDLDSTANNAVQQVALQWRLGDTGDYTNVPGAFIADATEPNAATKISNVFVTLPHLVLSQDRLYLRILTTNAVGSDEWIGIDNITVGCYVTTSASATVSGRVLGNGGNYVKGATVILTDREGTNYFTRTNDFGNYRFEGLFIGETYFIQPRTKNNAYSPKIIVVSSDLSDLDFVPETSNYLQIFQKSPPK